MDKHTKLVVEFACGVVYTVVHTLDTTLCKGPAVVLQCIYNGPAVNPTYTHYAHCTKAPLLGYYTSTKAPLLGYSVVP